MLTVKDAHLEVHKADTGAGFDFEIPGEDVQNVEMSRRINRRKDEGTILISNDDGTYSSGSTQISVGDRIDVFIAPQQSPVGWGNQHTGWGYGGWGGYRLLWSAWVKDPSYIREGPTSSSLQISGADYVFSILSNRITFDSYDDHEISGSETAILETVLARECPEIDLERVEDVDTRTSITASGTNVLELCIQLARRAGAMLWGYEDKLVFRPLDGIEPEFTVDPSSDIGLFEHTFKGGSVANVIRVDGGTDHAIDDEQTTQTGYTSVHEGTPTTFQVSTRKSQLERIELWTNKAGTQESINVRLQKDDGGAPIDPGDSQSDIDNKQLSHEFLANDGYTTFLLNDHTLPEPNPWVIVETDGSSGQNIGVRFSDGEPTYKAHYPFPVSVQIRDGASINEHTRIELRHKQDNLSTLDAAKEMAEESRDNFADPESDLEFPATSRRTHRLDPGEVITLDMPRERVEGDFIVREISETFSDNSYYTTVKAQEVTSI